MKGRLSVLEHSPAAFHVVVDELIHSGMPR